MALSQNSQNFLRKIRKIFVTLRGNKNQIHIENKYFINFYSRERQPEMISASKSTTPLKSLKILKPKVTKNLRSLHKKFCKFQPSSMINE